MCICFIRCGIKVTLFTIHMQTPKAYFTTHHYGAF